MKAAIFFSGRYGSTAQYAKWIGDATGFPVFDVKDTNADPSNYDLLILGSSVIIYKLTIRQWVDAKLASIEDKPIILFTVSGAPAGPKLDGWIAESLPGNRLSRMDHVALRGRQIPAELSWWHRLTLIIGAWKNDDPVARKEELEGFDFMDKSSIEPILELVRKFQSGVAGSPKHANSAQVTLD